MGTALDAARCPDDYQRGTIPPDYAPAFLMGAVRPRYYLTPGKGVSLVYVDSGFVFLASTLGIVRARKKLYTFRSLL